LIAAAARPVTPDQATRLEDFARRRLAGEPVARILEAREFWDCPLQLSAATLVPRPDTERWSRWRWKWWVLRLMRSATAHRDLGTGSGAILLALLSELPDAYGIGTDISVAALRTAVVIRPGWDLAHAQRSSPATMQRRWQLPSI